MTITQMCNSEIKTSPHFWYVVAASRKLETNNQLMMAERYSLTSARQETSASIWSVKLQYRGLMCAFE
jgi:hypothetical protein